MSIQCPQCEKILKGPSQLRIHSQIHQTKETSGSPPATAPLQNSQPIPTNQQVQRLPSIERMKQQIADSNEFLMMMSMNKQLRDSLKDVPHVSSVTQPSTTNDFLTQFKQMRDFEEGIKDRIYKDIDEDELEAEDDGSVEDKAMNVILGALNPAQNGNKTNLSDGETQTAEKTIDQVLV